MIPLSLKKNNILALKMIVLGKMTFGITKSALHSLSSTSRFVITVMKPAGTDLNVNGKIPFRACLIESTEFLLYSRVVVVAAGFKYTREPNYLVQWKDSTAPHTFYPKCHTRSKWLPLVALHHKMLRWIARFGTANFYP